MNESLNLTQSLPAGNSQISIENTSGTGNSVLVLRALSSTTQFQTDSTGYFKIAQRNTSTSNISTTGLEIYANGVVSTGNKTNNKCICLFESGLVGDNPTSTTSFAGFGFNNLTLRYQVATGSSTHKFYCGSTLGYTITNTGGVTAEW